MIKSHARVKEDGTRLIIFCTLWVVVYSNFFLRQPYAYDPLVYRYAGHLLALGKTPAVCDENNLNVGPYFIFSFFDHFEASTGCFAYGTSLGIAALLGTAEWLGGETGILLAIPILGAITLAGVWMLGWQLSGRRVAWLGVLLFAIHPLTISIATMPMSELI